MVAFSESFGGRRDSGQSSRQYMVRYNCEHSERYWLAAFEGTGRSHVIMLLDLQDPVALAIGTRMSGAERVKTLIEHCRNHNLIPTMHAAIPIESAIGALTGMHPRFVEYVQNCPESQFCVWCVAAGGSSLAYRDRPSVESSVSGTGSDGAI